MSAEPVRIPPRFLPWLRLAWGLVGIISIWTFSGTMVLTRQFVDELPTRLNEGLQALGWSHMTYFWFTVATILPLFLVNFVIGGLIFWLRPNDRMAVFTSFFAMSIGAANSFSPAHEYLVLQANAPLAIAIPAFISGTLSFGLLATFFATFPDGQFAPKWMHWIALEGFLFSLAWNTFPDAVGTFSGPWGFVGAIGALVMFSGSMVGQTWRYRNNATPLQKQQTKFAATARDEVDMDKLAAALLRVVEETMQPERVSVWLPATPRSHILPAVAVQDHL